MKQLFSIGRTVAALALFALFSTTAFAQATRTWVSGVGDDVNPCSRTAPCKTFAGAISKTAAGGVISVLDPGGFGAVTITKSITLESDGNIAGILNAGSNGVIINATATDDIVLRGLAIEGAGTGLNGVRFLAGKSLTVERCTINNQAGKGIDFSPTTAGAVLTVTDTQIHDVNNATNGGGISIAPTGAGTVTAAIERTTLSRGLFGIKIGTNVKATLSQSSVTNNDNVGIQATGATAAILIDDSVISHNGGTGVASLTSAQVTLSRSAVYSNGTGLAALSSGQILTTGDNRITGNTIVGVAPTGNAPQQ